jgi:hypothetical protein
MSNLNLANNQVDFCYKNACVKTKGPLADLLAGILIFTAVVAALSFLAKTLK